MTDLAVDETAGLKPAAWDRDDHPWRRYGGRMIDMSLFGLLALIPLAFLGGLFFPSFIDVVDPPTWWMSYLIMQPLMVLASCIGTALCLTFWGSTPGKWFFGIRVLNEDGGRLSSRHAFRRELHMFWWGAGLGLAPIAFFMAIRSFYELENEHQSRWDAQAGSIVFGRPVVGITYLLIGIGTLIVIAMKILDVAERLGAFA